MELTDTLQEQDSASRGLQTVKEGGPGDFAYLRPPSFEIISKVPKRVLEEPRKNYMSAFFSFAYLH